MQQLFKHTVLAVPLFFLTFPMMAQRTVVTATLRDSLSHETEPFATVRVFRQGNTAKPVAMAVADADGNISITVEGKGDYVITVASMGKTTVYRRFSLTGLTYTAPRRPAHHRRQQSPPRCRSGGTETRRDNDHRQDGLQRTAGR